MLAKSLISLIFNILILSASEPKILFTENFEDENFASRGWYDHLRGKITPLEHIEGSNYSLELKFLKGASTPDGGTPGRVLFEETDEVCLTYWVKYSSNYIGSGKPYHPHEFHFITNKDGKWVGPAFTHLTSYIEHNNGYPLLAIQDDKNSCRDKNFCLYNALICRFAYGFIFHSNWQLFTKICGSGMRREG